MTVRTMDGCIKCGACVRVCPVLREEGRDSFPGPRRLAVEAPRFAREAEAFGEQLEICTTCGRCRVACPSQLPLPEAVVRMRSLVPGSRSEGRLKMQRSFDKSGRSVSSSRAEEWPTEGDIAFFPGCLSDARLVEAVRASLELLKASGARPYVPRGWGCCGSPLEKIGDLDRLEKARAANAAALDGIDTIVTSCPGCTVQLQESCGRSALHIIEYLHSNGSLSSSSFDDDFPPRKVALHTPCHLSRVVGPHTMDMARELLSLVPGVELIDYDGEDECCGGGGGVASSRPDAALRMATRKVLSARRAGADVIIAPCPFCVTNLRKVGSLEVEELTSFLAERLLQQ